MAWSRRMAAAAFAFDAIGAIAVAGARPGEKPAARITCAKPVRRCAGGVDVFGTAEGGD
jgi:hypothetical protein